MVPATDILNAYRAARRAVYRAAEGLSQVDATWKPAPHVKSAQELLVHLGGAERAWLSALGYDVLDFPEGDDLDQTLRFLREMEALLADLVESASADEFNRPVETERGPLTLAWVLKRLTQHMFYHLGTLVYLRRAREPDWEGDAGTDYWRAAVDAFSELVRIDPA